MLELPTKKLTTGELGFRWRGREVTRVEAFSDAVLAFAVTLIVVSLEVPRSFTDLQHSMEGFLAFGICFALLLMIWNAHHIFFKRYALEDTFTVTMNAALMFVVLLYVYPLKFLFGSLVARMFGLGAEVSGTFTSLDQVRTLMIIYSIGWIAVFTCFMLLYLHASRLAGELELDEAERYHTRSSMQYHAVFIGIGVISLVIALIGGEGSLMWSGWIYALLGPILGFHGSRRGRGLRALLARDAPTTVGGLAG